MAESVVKVFSDQYTTFLKNENQSFSFDNLIPDEKQTLFKIAKHMLNMIEEGSAPINLAELYEKG